MNSHSASRESIAWAVSRSKNIESIVIEKEALLRVPDLLEQYYTGTRALIVGDENTMEAAGTRLEAILKNRSVNVETFVFPVRTYLESSVENSDSIIEQLKKQQAVPLAVGSGVINDLVKYAAFQLDIPYMCIGTAASMDGYASPGAPLSQKGFKHTIPCRPPKVIVADLAVIQKAPVEMAGWGYGDLCGKVPAGADWIIADCLEIEPVDDLAWPLVQNNLRSWIGNPAGVIEGATSAINELFSGLVLSSIAMEFHGSSRPASGADHQIAHMWEMDGLEVDGKHVSHGACVAIATLTVLSLYRWLLEQDFTKLDVEATVRDRTNLQQFKDEIRESFQSPNVADRATLEVEAKYIGDEQLKERLKRVKNRWPSLVDRLRTFLAPYENMKGMLEQAGVDTNPESRGIDVEYHRKTIIAARLIRRRYTILDLLEETGTLDAAIEAVFTA